VKSFWGRRKNDLFAKFASLRFLYKTIKKGEISFIIFYGNDVFVELFSILISKFFKIRIYKEESENPEVYFQGRTYFFNLLNKWFVVNKLYKFYSSVLVMTYTLRDFFLSRGIPDSKILVVPQTVDQERFEYENCNPTISLPNEYIAYVGSVSQQKDGVLTLVESFVKVSAKYPEMHLIIAGEGTQQEKNELSSLITKLQLNDRILYIGRISSEEIPPIFHRAKLLASCRPKSLQSDYGFPTKIVEYLASGKPTVTTATGELAFYLKDRVTAFVVSTAEHNLFASKMLEVLQNYDFAMNVAKNGRELIRYKFSPIIQTKKIIDFSKK
jgi:glycosyltransferase involved in cell wall biosynthesis